MASLMIKESLLGWPGTVFGKKRLKVWKMDPFCIFLDSLEGKKNSIVFFLNGNFSIQRLKYFYISLFAFTCKKKKI